MLSSPRRRLARPRTHRVLAEAMERRVMFSAGAEDLHIITSPMPQAWQTAPVDATANAGPLAAPSLTVPALSSRPSAFAKIYLDFDGQAATNWDGTAVPVTPAYTVDGDATTFSGLELANIQTIWARVAEKYSPFDIDVTTVRPADFNDNHAVQVVIGGDGAWMPGAGGVAYLNAFSQGWSNTCWVFSAQAPTQLQFVAEAAAHEAGHTFGLEHQSEYSGNTKVQEYSDGDPNTTDTTTPDVNIFAAKAPIMGVSYYASRGVWAKGRNSIGKSQDDMAVISRSANGFGYRDDDHGGSPSTADFAVVNGTALSGAGVIERNNDADYFSFASSAGTISLSVSPAAIGGMLDATLELRDANNNVLATRDTVALGESLSFTLPADGIYYVVVKGHGTYGDVGQYTLSGTIVTPPPLAANANGPYTVAENGSVQFSATGSTGIITSYEWDLNYDGVTFRPSGLTGAALTRSGSLFDGPSTRTIALRITGYRGATSIATAVLNITNAPPTATLAPVSVVEGSTSATLTFTDATDPSAADVAGLRYSFDFNNDGIFDLINSSSPTAVIPSSLVADGPATLTVKGRVTDKDGGQTDYTTTVTVTDVAPTLVTPAAANGHVVLGTGYSLSLAAQDPGADTISSWTVVWGDGQTSHVSTASAVFSHDYGAAGVYSVSITADDEDGSGYTLDRVVSVTSDAPTVSLTGGALTPDASTFQFTLLYSDDLGIRSNTLGDSDVSVTGPNGPLESVRLVSFAPTGDGRGIIATYEVAGPVGAWSWQDAGTFTVSVNANEIVDLQNDSLAAGAVGTFDVDLTAPEAPDLVAVYSGNLKLQPAGKSTATVKVYNRGSRNLPTSKVTTSLYLSTNPVWDASDTLLASSSQKFGLIINASKSVTFSFPTPKVTGTYYLVARADSRSAISERNERNNDTPNKIVLTGRAPDLAASFASKPKSSYKAGDSLAAVLRLTSVGATTASGPVGLKFVLSADAVLDDSDIVLATKTVSANLKSKVSSLFNFSGKLPASAAGHTWHLLAIASPAATGDTNTSNDVAVSSAFSVSPILI